MNRQRDRQTDRCKTEPQATERWAEWPESPTDTSERMSAEDGGGKRNCRKCRTDAERWARGAESRAETEEKGLRGD